MALHPSRTARPRLASLSMPTRPSAVTQGVRALCLAFALGAAGAALAQASPPAAASASASYDIPAGALGPALSRFAAQAGVTLSFEPALTEGRQTAGLRGSHAVGDGFARLLAGTGLDAVPRAGGGYTLRPSPPGASAAAPGNAGTNTLSEVRVTAQAERSATTEGSGSYASRIVTVGKGEQALKEIPQSITVVTRQKMDDQNLNTIDEVLAQTTGITMYDSPMGGRYVYSRGFRVDTYQFDGVNRAFYYPQANNFTSNAATLDRVEVVRGATGLLQGAGAPSATINMVRKRPTAEKQLQLSASAGSWNNLRTELDASGPINEAGTLRGRVVASANDRDYFYDTAKSRTGVLYGVLEADIGPRTLLTLGASDEKLKSTPFFQGLPRYSNGADLHLRRSTALMADWNRWNSEQRTVFAELAHRFDADWSLKLTAGYVREQHDIKYAFALGAVNPRTLAGNVMYGGLFDFETENKTLDLAVDGKFDAFGRRHALSFGANTGRMVNHSDFALIQMVGVANNVFDPVSAIAEPSAATFAANSYRGGDAITRMTQSGAYGVARLSLSDPLTLVAGARVTRYTGSTRDRATGADTSEPFRESGVLTPYGGLVYALNPQWSAYVSYADIFQPQNAMTAAGDLLPPIKGRNYEAGLKGELFDGKVNASLALFRIDQNNRAQEDLVNVCTRSTYCSVSTGKVRSQGLDAEISGELARGWQVFAGYTLNHFKYLDDTANAGIDFASTYSPKHMLRVWTDYRLLGTLNAWTLGGGVNFQTASTRTTGAITLEQASYAVWGARVGYQINRHWSAALNLANLFDKTYYQTIGAPAWGNFYGEPRSVTVSLRGRF
ncbi:MULTISPECIES: TonB-dependent receptor [unclassified Variovorax]|uniref:TonB-dependent siderophore receptor n=1 Tax=unclassified Variovorax TaxID=663243 RepID=UPI002576D28B|nr:MULTISPECIES: TonB-dependent receptor [unclassified Variovorax]MDM0087745.1 TonB-dependent siderophore receptor [Variovorax sp. J22G40]MDM0143998.1 TonB-dependent siderophore receptor [Variovorax sp. J2P1-31]